MRSAVEVSLSALNAGQNAFACGLDERGENEGAVRRAEQRVDRVLRMRHQGHDVPAFVDDARNVISRTVYLLRVAKGDLTVRLELLVEGIVREPAAFAVLHRDREPLPFGAAGCERTVGPFDDERHVAANEGQRFVPAEDSRQQAGLAED